MPQRADPRPSRAQKATIARVMHAFKAGDLEAQGGRPVRDPRQAIAIALREAGASDQESPAGNRRSFARTRRRERAAEATRAELYAKAKARNLPGRSRMTKDELVRALNP